MLGDLSIQGNIKPLPSLNEPLQVGMNNGARRACIPIENKRHFFDVPADVVEKVDPIFYGEPMVCAKGYGGLAYGTNSANYGDTIRNLESSPFFLWHLQAVRLPT